MWKNMKTPVKAIVIVLIFGGLYFGLTEAASHGLLPSNIGKVMAPAKYNLPDVKDAEIPNVAPAPYPSFTPANVTGTKILGELWEWSAQDGFLLAIGGPCTTEGSLMEKYGVNLCVQRQDDTNKMGQDLLHCATQIHDGASECTTGANFVIIMGDGAAQFAAGLNPQLLKLGPDYGLKVIGAVGYSRGEDAFMAPPVVKSNPHDFSSVTNGNTTGLLVEGVLRDGDWNIAEKWAGDNSINNNPNDTTYDKTALNWINAPDYNTAASDYVAGKCEDRKEVANGKLTGNSVHVCVNAVVTWTPGDVTAAEKKGGLVKVVSSLQYRSQMPAVIVGPAHFFNANRAEITNLLQASFAGADQVKAFDAALRKASEIAAKVYNDQGCDTCSGGSYWYKYFHPVKESDAQGLPVTLGGSAVTNLADNQILFGMNPGSNDNFRSTYSIFSAIDFQQYPDLFKVNGPTPLPDVKAVEDKSFITGVLLAQSNSDTQGAGADVADYSGGSGAVVSKRSYSINFATGSAQPLPDGEVTLAGLKDQVAITGLKIKVDGFTDASGSPQVNTALSAARAQEVKMWLQQHARSDFPDNRFAGVAGHGPENPVADNSTADGRAKNRRVEVTLVE